MQLGQEAAYRLIAKEELRVIKVHNSDLAADNLKLAVAVLLTLLGTAMCATCWWRHRPLLDVSILFSNINTVQHWQPGGAIP